MALNAVTNMNFFVDPNNVLSSSYFGFYAKKNPDTQTVNQQMQFSILLIMVM